jgi:Tfp pilus assembly protein FimT
MVGHSTAELSVGGLGDVEVAMEHGHKGFSVIELMFGFFIVAIVSIFALPSLSRTEQTYKLVAAANDVQARLQYARIQAVNRNVDHRIRVASAASYVLERRSGGSWTVTETYAMATGFSISASGTAEFHSRGNANPVTDFTVSNSSSETRQVAVETSGYIHAEE